ncbi:MAG TPA: ECF transporter S component [bacterium]|nr:ECF transporter S component [bacterium]
MTGKTRHLVLGGLFIALGVLFPILFHLIGMGSVFLPMFWPLAVGSFFLPPLFAVLTGVLTPLVSTLTTGMPPVPTVYWMTGELAVLGGVVSGLRFRTGLGSFWILLAGLLASRIVLFILTKFLAPLIGLPGTAAAFYLLVKGMPGMIVMLILIPALLSRLENRPVFALRRPHG